MRFIDNSEVGDSLDPDWHTRAEEAYRKACNATTAKGRKKVLKKRAHVQVWRDAAGTLASISNGKCWYCEVREVRSDMPVDHYRPKGKVVEENGHGGYWWLAFNWENFRLSCTFCNSRRVDVKHKTEGGKHDHFPLCDGSYRACNDDNEWRREIPKLLDPCSRQDPTLLSFRQDGMPVPSREPRTDAVAHDRADCSIRLLHLDHHHLVRSRKRLWKRVNGLVDRGTRYVEQGLTTPHGPLDDVKDDLHELIRRSEPLCRVAHLALRGHRDLEWVREWLEDMETTL
jgi:uncharacterized protein (TIGR02646 family)